MIRKDNLKNSKRINYQITSDKVRVVSGNVENKLYSLKEAITLAKELELDLIEMSCTPEFSICKIMDYSKLQYEEKLKKKEQERKNKKSEVKEIRLTPTTDTHDFNFKLKHAHEFLLKGDKVKVVVQFVGRELNYKEPIQKVGFLVLNFYIFRVLHKKIR